MDRDTALARLESLQKRTEAYVEKRRDGIEGHEEAKHLEWDWEELVKDIRTLSDEEKKEVNGERIKIQAALRLKVAIGEYPLIVAEIISGPDAEVIRPLLADIRCVIKESGFFLQGVTRPQVKELLERKLSIRRCTCEIFDDPHEAGYLAYRWIQEPYIPPFTKNQDDRKVFLASYPGPVQESPEWHRERTPLLPPTKESSLVSEKYKDKEDYVILGDVIPDLIYLGSAVLKKLGFLKERRS